MDIARLLSQTAAPDRRPAVWTQPLCPYDELGATD
jgi:hypothetical protein